MTEENLESYIKINRFLGKLIIEANDPDKPIDIEVFGDGAKVMSGSYMEQGEIPIKSMAESISIGERKKEER